MPGPNHNRKPEKAKNFGQAIKSLFSYLKKDAWILAVAVVLSVVGAVLNIIGPSKISEITDYIFSGLTGGVNEQEITEDIKNQIQTGKIDIFKYLPEGVDPQSIDISQFGDDDPELYGNLIASIKLSDEYVSTHQDTGINLNAITQVAIVLLIIYVSGAICTFLQQYMMATVSQKVSKRMRCDIDQKINRLPLKYFSTNSYGDLLSRVTNDVDTIGQSLSNSIASIASALAQLVGCVIMMMITNIPLALTTILSTIVGIILMTQIMKRSQRYFNDRQRNLGALNGYIEESYGNHDVVRIMNADQKVCHKFERFNEKVKTANLKSQFLSGLMQPLMAFIGNLGYVAVCIVGAMLVINGNITFGIITAFLIYVRLFSQPLSQIAQGMTNVQSAAAASERVFEFLNEEELTDESDKISNIKDVAGKVEFRNVKFAYPSNPEREIIHNFSVKVKPGQKVAIVGPTGAGKTTLVNLLMRFFEPTEGKILVDEIDTRSIKRENVHNLFGMVLQDTWLFEGTVRENLKFNLKNVSDETMIEACKACGIHDFIKSLSQGYDTILDDNPSISSGQKQLLTIARAMIQNSPMLILDEATSNVDTKTELVTQEAMDKLSHGRTSFVIAHRLSTIKNADLILVMKNGDIIEQGNHDELMAKNGFYAGLYSSQFEKV